MVCVLTQEQLDKLFQKVVKDLLTISETGKPFVLKDYILSLYNRVNEKTGNQALAQTYAALIPSKVALARAVSKGVKDLIKPVQVGEIAQLEADFEEFDKVGNYLGVKVDVLEVEDPPAPNEQKKIDSRYVPVSKFTGRPNTFFSTTGYEENPDLLFSFGFTRTMGKKDDTSSDTTGYYLTMMLGSKVLRDAETKDESLRGSVVSVITDSEGNPIYFDEKYKITTPEEGKIVFYPVRDNYDQLQSTKEVSYTRGLNSEDEAASLLKKEKRAIDLAKQYILAGGNVKVINRIVSTTNGFLNVDYNNPVQIKDYLSSFSDHRISIEQEKTGNKTQTKAYLKTSNPNDPSVEIRFNKVKDFGEFLDDSVKIILGTNVTDAFGNTGKSSTTLRQAFLRIFYGNNSTLRINEAGKVYSVTKQDGKSVWTELTTEDQVREALMFYKNQKGNKTDAAGSIYQEYSKGDLVKYEKTDSGYKLSPTMTAGEYLSYVLNNSYTYSQANQQGTFVPLHPYFVFEPTLETKDLLREYKTKGDEIITPKSEESIEEEPVKTETPTAEQKPAEKRKFVKREVPGSKKTLTDDEVKDEIRKKLNKLNTQRDPSEQITEEQIEQAKAWYENHPISKHVPFIVMFDAFNTENPKSVATWTEAGITLFKGSNFTDLYHEAFHAFSQMFITAKERQKIYNEVRNQSGSFKSHTGRRIKFSDATDIEVEEYLAEGFRKYMLSNGKKTLASVPAAKSFFQKLLELLQALFNVRTEETVTNYEASTFLNDLYHKLRVGNINSTPYGMENRAFDKLNKIIATDPEFQAELDELPYSLQIELVESIDSLFSQISDEYNSEETSGLKYTTSLVKNPKERAVVYNKIYNAFLEKHAELEEQLDTLDSSLPEYDDILKAYNVLSAALNNFSSSKTDVITADDIMEAQKDGKGLIAYHMQKSKFMSFEEKFDSIYDAEEKSKNSRGEFNKNSGNEVSAKDLAADDVHYLIRGLFKYDTSGKTIEKNFFGFNKLEDFDIAWNRIQSLLEGARNADEIYNRLYEASIMKGNNKSRMFKQLLDKLGKPNNFAENEKVNLAQINLWTNFTNAFTLKRIPLTQVTVKINTVTSNDEGNIVSRKKVTITTGAASSDTDSIKRQWDNKFGDPAKQNVFIKRPAPGSVALGSSRSQTAYLDLKKIINDFSDKEYAKDPIRFLHAVGMDVTEHPEIVKQLKASKSKLGDFTRLIYERLQAFNLAGTFVNKPSELIDREVNGETLSGLYKNLLELERRYSDIYGSNMVSNASRDAQFELSLRSTIANMIDNINEVDNYHDLFEVNESGVLRYPEMAFLDYRRNPFVKNLIIMERIFGEEFWKEGKGNKQVDETIATAGKVRGIALLNSSGVSLTEEDNHLLGISSNEADETTSILQNFYSFVQYGVSEGTRHSDKSSTFLYKLTGSGKYYIPLSRFALNEDGFTAGVNRMVKYLSSEVERIYKLQNGDEAGNTIVGDSTYKEIGSKLVAFEDILLPATRAMVMKNISEDFEKTLESKQKLREAVQKDISRYLLIQINNFKEDFNTTGAGNSRDLMSALRENIFIGKKGAESSVKLSNEEKDNALFSGYVINDIIHKFETTSLFYGDVALYNHFKEEFHKRNAGIAATGTIPRTDNSMLSLLNGYYRDRYKDSEMFKEMESMGYGLTEYARNRRRGKTMNSAVMQDPKVASKYLGEYVKIAKQAEAKRLGRKLTEKESKEIDSNFSEYGSMKIGDAQGWITFDAYRALLISLGKWSQYQDDMYNAIIDGKEVSASDIAQFFPVKKMQYWGPLATKAGLPVTAFHKFSLMPLVPSLIKGTNLEKLHNKMVSQGIDYATLQTGSKVSTVTKNGQADKFYTYNSLKNENGEYDNQVEFEKPDYEFTRNEIFLDYFKDQLEISDKYKGSVIFSTQLRKLIEEGLYENGKPKSFTGTKEEFDALSEKQKSKYEEYVLINKYEGLVAKLTEYKMKELIKETDITYDPSTDTYKFNEKLIDFVRKELTRQELAEHEIDFIKYDVAANNLMYDLSIHPSAERIEKLLSTIIYKRLVRQKVNGEALIQVSGAGFEAAGLRSATKEEIAKYGTNGLKFYEYGKGGTKAMQVKIALQGDFKKLLKHPEVVAIAKARGISNFDALNIAIKDEKWLAENKQMITIAGVRIPVQGLNSMEFMQIAEFLPENSGNMVILPAEIVAKSGSDFDIDKLSLMFPSLLKTSKGVSIVKHNSKLDIDIDATKQKIKDLYTNLSAASEDFLEYSKNYLQSIPQELKSDFYETVRAYKDEIRRINNEIMNQFESGELYPKNLYDELYDMQEELNDLFKEAAKPLQDYKNEKIGTIVNEIDNLKTQLAEASSDGIENDLLDTVVDILSLPENFLDLITPNGTYIIKPIAENLAKDVRDYNSFDSLSNDGESYKDSKNNNRISATRIFELRYNRYKQSSNNIGKKTLGMGAVDNTFNTIFNRVGAYMSKSITLSADTKNPYSVNQVIRGMNHNTVKVNGEDVISLSNLYDSDKKYRISNVISQMMNGWVDVAKDSWIFDVQGNPEISSTLLFMIQAGIPVEQAIYFVSQPIVRDYVKEIRKVKSVFAKALNVPSGGTNMFRVEARRQLLTKLFPEARYSVDKKGREIDNFDNYKQKRFIYQNLTEQYLADPDFSLDTLKGNIKKKDSYTKTDQEVFLHFIELEEMAKATTALKLTLNFDTSRQSSLYEIREKQENLKDLIEERRMPLDVVEAILKNSPIGSFNTSKEAFGLVRSMFPTRDNEIFQDFIRMEFSDIYEDTVKQQYGQFFRTKEELVSGFINDFTSFIYQQFLKDPLRFNPRDSYKGLEVNVDVEKVKEFTTGAYVENNILYVDLARLNRDFKERSYTKPSYLNSRERAIVSENYFLNQNEFSARADFFKFVYEREGLRSVISFDEYRKTVDFGYRMDELALNKPSTSLPLEQVAYEEFLRDHALFNTQNINFMFRDVNGYANQLMKIVSMHPELASKYDVLNSLHAVGRGGIFNLRISEAQLDEKTKSIYHENLKNLSDPTVQKVDNQLDNQIISKMFSLLPVFNLIQSGQSLKGQFSLAPIVDNSSLLNAQNESVQWMNDKLNSDQFILYHYLDLFNAMYKKATVLDEDMADEPMPSTVKGKIKDYQNLPELKIADKKFISQAGYDPNVSLYSETQGKEARISDFVKNIMEFIGVENTQKVADKIDPNSILDMRRNKIDYTVGQRKALLDVADMINSEKGGYYLLAGYAGTGKTTIAENIAKYSIKANKDILIIAPTNKAANVLNDKLRSTGASASASTIHKTIYGAPDPETGQWIKSKSLHNSVIIIDESSMIDDSVMKDLLENTENRGNTVIFMGDSFQLEPIGKDPGLFTGGVVQVKNNRTELTEVKRQSLDSDILKLATLIRTDKVAYVPSESSKDVIVTSSKDTFTENFKKDIRSGKDVAMIVATNQERINMNKIARDVKFGENAQNPLNGNETLISIANSDQFANSEMFKVSVAEDSSQKFSVTFEKNGKATVEDIYLYEAIDEKGNRVNILLFPTTSKPSVYHPEILKAAQSNPEFLRQLQPFIETTRNGTKKLSKSLTIATYGYSITAHKSQGSQWEKVFVNQNYVADTWNGARWFYTAITRASKQIEVLPTSANTRVDQNTINTKLDSIVSEDVEPGKVSKFEGEMTFSYNGNQRDGITSDTTLMQ